MAIDNTVLSIFIPVRRLLRAFSIAAYVVMNFDVEFLSPVYVSSVLKIKEEKGKTS